MREQKRLLIYHLAFASLMVLVVMTAALSVVFLRLRDSIRMDILGEPFLLAVLIAWGCGLTVMVIGTGGILRASRPLLDRLDESEERNTELLEATTDGVLDFDAGGRITSINPAAERAFGYTKRALLGQSITKLVIGHSGNEDFQIPAVQRTAPGVLEDLLRPCRGLLTQGRREDGTVFPLELTIVEQGSNGDRRFVAVVRDLTESYMQQRELAESEERFRVLSKASFEGIALFDDGKVLDNNQALTSMLALGSSSLKGEVLLDCFSPADRDKVRALLVSGEADSSTEVTALRSDGSTFPCEIAVKRIPYRGRSAGVIALRDISERKQVQGVIQQFERSEAELAAIQKTAATYAHEINNPLTGVLGMLQMLMEEEPDREKLDMLNDALSCSRRIKDVMSKLSQVTSPRYRHYLRAETEIIDLDLDEQPAVPTQTRQAS